MTVVFPNRLLIEKGSKMTRHDTKHWYVLKKKEIIVNYMVGHFALKKEESKK